MIRSHRHLFFPPAMTATIAPTNSKDQRLARWCAEQGVDGVHLCRRSNIAWITDGADTRVDGSSRLGIAEVVWTPQRKLVLTDTIEAPRLAREEFGSEWEIRAADWWKGRPSPASLDLQLARDWPHDAIAPLRWSLTDREMACVRALGQEAATVLEESMHRLARGTTEAQLAGTIVGSLRARGIETPVMLVASDARLASFRHPIPTAKPVESIAMAVICAERHGLIVSATRLRSFGPPDADRIRRHAAVCAVDRTLHAATRPGARWCDILAAGIQTYAATHFAEEWTKHHQGGPMGYELREFVATPSEERRVVDRQLVGWNPSIAGTKSEDTILVTRDRHEIVTATGNWPLADGRPEILVG